MHMIFVVEAHFGKKYVMNCVENIANYYSLFLQHSIKLSQMRKGSLYSGVQALFKSPGASRNT